MLVSEGFPSVCDVLDSHAEQKKSHDARHALETRLPEKAETTGSYPPTRALKGRIGGHSTPLQLKPPAAV